MLGPVVPLRSRGRVHVRRTSPGYPVPRRTQPICSPSVTRLTPAVGGAKCMCRCRCGRRRRPPKRPSTQTVGPSPTFLHCIDPERVGHLAVGVTRGRVLHPTVDHVTGPPHGGTRGPMASVPHGSTGDRHGRLVHVALIGRDPWATRQGDACCQNGLTSSGGGRTCSSPRRDLQARRCPRTRHHRWTVTSAVWWGFRPPGQWFDHALNEPGARPK